MSSRPRRRDRRKEAAAEIDETAAEREHDDPDSEDRLCKLLDHPSAHEEHAEGRGCEDHARLQRPEDARERRPHAPDRRLDRDRRRLEEAAPGRRLHIGHQVLVRGEAVEQLRVHFGLDLGRPVPPAILDERPDHPGDCKGGGGEACEDRQPLDHVPEGVHGARLCVLRPAGVPELVLDVLQVEGRVLDHFGMLPQKQGERGVRGQVRLIAHHRWIQPHHAAHCRRQPLQQGLEVVAGLLCVLVVGDEDLGRRGARGLLLRGGLWRPLRGSRERRIGEKQQADDRCDAEAGQTSEHWVTPHPSTTQPERRG